MISVVFCTARQGGLDILKKSMDTQTFRDFEVIVVDRLNLKSGFIDIPHPPIKPQMYYALSESLNVGVRAAKGELIVLLQDYIVVPPDGLQRFWDCYQKEPKSLVSGVSDQYDFHTGEKVFKDPRKEGYTGFYLTIPLHWEANWGSFPRQAWLDVGGFDERYDAGWGYDNVDFSDRCQHAGYHIFLDTNNEVYCYSHIRLFNEQNTRQGCPNNEILYSRLERARHQGLEPWKLSYA